MDDVIVIGIDPGLANGGIAAIERNASALKLVTNERIKTSPELATELRIASICISLRERLEILRVSWGPIDLVAIEEQRFVQQGKMQRDETRFEALPVRDVQYALAGVAWALQIDVLFVHPQTAKKALTGSGRAGKQQVARSAAAIFGTGMRLSEHEYDALAVAMAGAQRWRT